MIGVPYSGMFCNKSMQTWMTIDSHSTYHLRCKWKETGKYDDVTYPLCGCSDLPDLPLGEYQVSFSIEYRKKANGPKSKFHTATFNYKFTVEWVLVQDCSRWDRYLGMTAVMTQVPHGYSIGVRIICDMSQSILLWYKYSLDKGKCQYQSGTALISDSPDGIRRNESFFQSYPPKCYKTPEHLFKLLPRQTLFRSCRGLLRGTFCNFVAWNDKIIVKWNIWNWN